MCGIAGLISFNSIISEFDINEGRGMTSILRHRGPDDIGYFSDQNCFLGNTRLKIIDLSDDGNLPMSNSDKTIYIAYNGEVTNFRDLKKEFNLEAKYKFKSTTDTEVVLHLYEECGLKFLDYLSGQFVFAIYDKKLKKIFIVRDQFGIRPIFYMQKRGKFYFSSEIKSFLGLSNFSNDINYQAIYDYFSLIYIPGQQTPFNDIVELDGGHFIEIDLNTKDVKLKEYYRINYQPNYAMSEKEATSGFYDVMLDSMDRNMISDAPLGITLSGGIDTSVMLSLAKELGKSEKIHTFSLKINESSFDESPYQKIMVDYAKPIHHEVVINPEDVIENLIIQMAHMDEPSGNGAVIPSFLLAKEASKHVKVLLSGEGGDEVSNAYDTHVAYKMRKVYRKYTPSFVRKIVYDLAHALPVSYEKLSFDFLVKRFTEGAEKNAAAAHMYWRHVFKESEKKSLLKKDYSSHRATENIFEDMFNESDFKDGLNKISLIDFKYFFICDLMVKNDRTFMANSVEARFPFVDKKVVDFITKVPPKYRIKGFNARYIEKAAMKNIVPKKILKRRSMGLEMPHSLWFFKGLEKVFKKYLTKKNIEKCGIFNYEYVNQLWNEHTNHKRDNGRALWSILNYLIWFDLFVYNKDYKNYLN